MFDGFIASTYVTKKRGKWEAGIAREGEHLARGSRYDINGAAECHNYENDRHDCSTPMGTCGAEKKLKVRLSCRTVNGLFDVVNAKAKCQDHDEACNAVEQDCLHHP